MDAIATQQADRRAQIFDAAEKCFTRAGFHRTTMQDIAAEAGMSPGNLYRYFASKDAVMEGLADRDRAEVAADFAHFETGEDFMSMFYALGKKHLADEPREKAILCLEIWAEATRNANFNGIVQAFQEDLVSRLTRVFTVAQERGAVRAKADPRALAVLVATISDGLFVRRAVVDSFDAASEVPHVLCLIGAILDGQVDFSNAAGKGNCAADVQNGTPSC